MIVLCHKLSSLRECTTSSRHSGGVLLLFLFSYCSSMSFTWYTTHFNTSLPTRHFLSNFGYLHTTVRTRSWERICGYENITAVTSYL